MPNTGALDKPEPRWQAILALIAVGGIYTALPSELSVGPRWLLLTIVLVLLVPAVVAHRTGRHSLNHLLGIINNSVITAALVGSLALLSRWIAEPQRGAALPPPVGGITLVDQRPHLRPLVLEIGRRRPFRSASTGFLRESRLSVSSDSD